MTIKYDIIEYLNIVVIKIGVTIQACKDFIDLFYQSVHIYKYFAKLLLRIEITLSFPVCFLATFNWLTRALFPDLIKGSSSYCIV